MIDSEPFNHAPKIALLLPTSSASLGGCFVIGSSNSTKNTNDRDGGHAVALLVASTIVGRYKSKLVDLID